MSTKALNRPNAKAITVLLLGSGGREHALAKAITKSPLCLRLVCLPGNAGIAEIATCLAGNPCDPELLLKVCKDHDVNFVISGSEAPLVAGVTDILEKAGIPVFGCSKAAAQLEGSKAYFKDLCRRANITTAKSETFTDAAKALAYVRAQGAPIVIKADGLAAGKGVTVAMTLEEATDAVKAALVDKVFGESGNTIVVEEFLDGEEISYFALANGRNLFPLTSAQDHKRAFDGDMGPNTGGMGAYSPAPACTAEIEEQIIHTILKPTIATMIEDGTPFVGVLFAGIMIVTENGQKTAKLLEYNIRFGDPECQVILPRINNDVLEILWDLRQNTLQNHDFDWSARTALTVVMAAKGYPYEFQKGTEIKGLKQLNGLDGVSVTHAATKFEDGKLLANGGRVLNVTALGDTVREAQSKAYAAISLIDWPDGFYRKDIGWRALDRD